MKKRLLAMLLALMLVVGLLPVGVLAVDDVSTLRLMNRDEWRSSALARAGVGEGDDVDIQQIFVYDQYNNLLNNGSGIGVVGIDEDWFNTYTSPKGINTDDIDKIILLFTYTKYVEGTTTVAAVFDKVDFYVGDSSGVDGSRYADIRLTDRGKTLPDGIQVNFYAAIGNRTDYVLYDTVYVNSGETIGSEMPATPDTGEYHFVGWQTELDGSGKALFSDTVITEPWTVYGAKVSAEGGTQYHVMKNSTGGVVNALNAKLAELYGGGVDANSFHITAMRVNDSEGKHTNENYIGNEWKDNTYYLIWNNSAENPADPGADHKNTRILVEDIASLTVYGTIGSTEGETFEITISRSELEFQKVSDEIIEIKIRDDKVNEPEPGPGPDDPEEPRDPTDTELRKLAVVLECTNGEVEHDEKTKAFHLRTTNSKCEIQQVGKEYICSVTPDYDKILSTYNTATKATHVYEVEGKQFVLTWNASTNAWENAGGPSITSQVKCETPEPENQHVDVYAVKDRNYDTRVLIGSFMAPVGTNVIEFVEAQTLDEPEGFDKYERANDGYYRDGLEYTFGENDTVSDWTNVYVNYIGKEQTVQVVIYRNGDITTPYKTESIGPMRTGETLDTTKLDISEYYTQDKFATGFDYEGWFNDGAWNDYKDAGCPEDATGLDEIVINGWTNVIAMVWDQFPVYYNIVDENGTVVEEKIYTDTITERDLEDYTFYNASRTGYTFDGWYQDEKDVGDASKLLTGLNKAKKWELYGRYDPIPYNLVIYAAIDKDKDNAVNIYSGMVDYGTPLVAYLETLDLKTDVFPGYSPEDGKWYKYDSPKWTFGENDTVSGWTNVLINYVPNEYTIYYHGSGGVTESGAEQSTSTFKYGSEATIKNNPFTYEGYAFEGWALSADGEVVYTGSEKVPFTEEYFRGLLENGKVEFYAVWAEDELGGGDNGNEPDGIADYRQVFVKYVAADGNGSVDPRFNTFSLEVDENGKVMTNVALSLEGVATPNGDATFAYWTIDGLGFDGGAYSYEANLSGKGFTGYVAGQTYTFTAYFNGPVVKPEQPDVYKIYVTVHNGTATFCGSEVTSHILAAENEDITITFTPEEGYTLDYATIDGNMLLIPDGGVYTLKLVDSDHTIEVFYAEDKLGGGEDGDEPRRHT